MNRRVVVTGMGAVTPVGNSVGESWEALCSGQSGIGPITKFDAAAFDTRIAGELKGFDPLRYVTKRERRRYDDFIIFALAAAEMAVADAALPVNGPEADRTGVIIASAIGGLETIDKEKEALLAGGPKKMSVFAIPAVLANLAAGHVSIRFGAKGPISCPVTACAAGTCAIGDAFYLIRYGHADVMFAGGTDAAVTALAVGGFNQMRALSVRNGEPEKASRPFDRDRDGFVLSEGAGVVILEELRHALDRGARHEGAARCMKAALADAGMRPEDIDCINAHGTSTPLNDLYETQAIKTVFGSHSRSLAVPSTKSMTGHLLGATGAVEAIFAAKSIEDGIIPPTINLDHPDPECDLDYVPNTARKRAVSTVMSNTFGFGGVNAVLILKKYGG
ncbi:MAG: 3-oxoacyl-(acyl-carrier-protein) synthase 2 [Syntrophaceae bacterium PtaU1.Bin231]|nr:MAG: 3-oxoacyl-(acyl-carrier-protein) synthase 2 [Syntrophaceae bacterium PtaU1.Bin231]